MPQFSNLPDSCVCVDASAPHSTPAARYGNIAARLTAHAGQRPDSPAIISPIRISPWRRRQVRRLSFHELDERSNRLADALLQRGARPGMKLVLFVPFSAEFIELTFALLKAGIVVVLIDPGMGRTNIFRCLEEVRPDGFVAIPAVHLVRWGAGAALRRAPFNICVGGWLPGMAGTYEQLLRSGHPDFPGTAVCSTDPAAVIFTSGSTGPPKGVQYEHGMFNAQVEMIQSRYGIEPGEVDLPGFPLFGLFNAAMGVTTVIPEMDPTRPAQVDPVKILSALERYQVTQAFGSPAFWNRVGRYCIEHNVQLPGLRRALSAGGPVPEHVLQRLSRILTGPGADLYTPYGATESLPVCSIGARQVLSETAERSRAGAGTCVGTPFRETQVRIIERTDRPLENWTDARELPPGEIGEIVASGPSVTRAYFSRPEATRRAKIADGDRFWHRMGDVGYLDKSGRLWFCGRAAHVVTTGSQILYSVCCESIFDQHPQIYRTALVGLGKPGAQQPVIVAEPESGHWPQTPAQTEKLKQELLALAAAHEQTRQVATILFHRSLPVDTRHNVKINREALADWAQTQLSQQDS